MKAVVLLLFLCLAVASAELSPRKNYPDSCTSVKPKKNGIYTIQLSNGQVIDVFCDVYLTGDPWLVIQRRTNIETNFYRKWTAYQQGFGQMDGNFFIGLNRLNILTNKRHELYIYLVDYEDKKLFARYSEFAIGNEANLYGLNVLGTYSGNAGDSLSYHKNMKFSTYDKDNDLAYATNCAVNFTGAWWYKNCHESNLNGLFLEGDYSLDQFGRGTSWYSWKGHFYGYKYIQMMIRPR
ncbi:ryncolin-4-like [Drosophila busckii]|uniref:ryncolin-4-like n=1 Tax=Drosophila busckii TaxID=30019 RepID=UPI00083F024C|nr:ryncolin-4-like [Drosophila busckii]